MLSEREREEKNLIFYNTHLSANDESRPSRRYSAYLFKF